MTTELRKPGSIANWGRNAQVRGESKCKGLVVGVLGVFEERQSRENGGE